MAYGIEEELPHFLRAYAAQYALGHKVLDKEKYLRYFPNNTTNSFHYSSRKHKINYHLTESLIMRYHCARGLSLLSVRYTVLAPLNY